MNWLERRRMKRMVKVLRVRSGDTLVYTCQDRIDASRADQIKWAITAALPAPVPVLVVDSRGSLSVIRPEGDQH